jgi:hypothetical protein
MRFEKELTLTLALISYRLIAMIKEWSGLNTTIQNEALINEFKGHLFEFLVSQKLAQFFKKEAAFYSDLPNPLTLQLAGYEKWLRENDHHLWKQLPFLANEVKERLAPLLPSDIEKIFLTGGSQESSNKDLMAESDILLTTNEKLIPISLKLCKSGAFVNTKSGGIRSFLSKYFNRLGPELSSDRQAELGLFIDQSFEQLGIELYARHALVWNGKFDHQWIERGLSELPGQLSENDRSLIHAHYERVIGLLYQKVEEAFSCADNLEQIGEVLAPLVGLSLKNMIVVTCFHGIVDGSKYGLKSLHTFSWEEYKKQWGTLELGELKKERSSFEVLFQKFILQIRVKPMNKFTVPGLKVNCSIKDRYELAH